MPVAESQRFAPLDWALLLGAAGIWGMSFLLMAIELETLEPSVVTLGRVGIGALAVWALPSAHQRLPRRAWGRITAIAITWMAFPLSMFPIAQQWIDSSVAGMLNGAMPLGTAAIAALFFGIRTERRQLLGILVGLLGIVAIAVPTASLGETTALGVGLVVAATISYGVAINLAVPLQAEFGTIPVLARALAVATLLCTPLAVPDMPGSVPDIETIAAALVLGAFGSGYAFVFASILGQRVGPVRTSIITYVVPIVSVILGVAIRDEQVSAWALAGTALVLVGARLASARSTTMNVIHGGDPLPAAASGDV